MIQQLVRQLAEAEQDLILIRARVKQLNAQLVAEEDKLITAKLLVDNLTLELQYVRANHVLNEDDLRDKEIERFRNKFPELCKKEEE